MALSPLEQVMLQGQQVPTVEADGGGVLNQAQPQAVLAQAQPQQQAAPQDWYQMKAPTGADWGNALAALGRGFTIAGSANPGQTYHEFARADKEAAELKKPKVTPLADGAFSLVSYPDGTTKIVKNSDVAQYLGDLQGTKFEQALQKVILQSRAGVDAANDKETFKKLEEKAGGVNASTDFSADVKSSMDKLSGLSDWLKNGGDNVPLLGNNPLAADIADRTIGRATGNKNYEQRRFMDQFIGLSVMDAASSMKGSLSDKDVVFLKSIQPKSDDPTEMKIRYFNEFAARLKKNEDERVQAARDLRSGNTNAPRPGGQPAAAPSGPAASASSIGSDVYSSKAPSEWGAYDPNAYEYRMNNGVLQRRKK